MNKFPNGTRILCTDDKHRGEKAVVDYAPQTIGVLAKLLGEENESENKWVYYYADNLEFILLEQE